MSDDQNTTQNPISTENSIPPSPQEPMADMPIPITVSEPSNMPPEALETPKNVDNAVPVNNDNLENTPILTEKPEVITPIEPTNMPVNHASSEINNPTIKQNPEPISEPVQAIEPLDSASTPQATAQIPPNEPFEDTQAKPSAPKPEINIEPLKVQTPETQTRAEATPPPSMPEPEKIIPVPVIVAVPNKNKIFELLAKAKNVIQFRKRKKLDKVMAMFLKKSKITNDEVEKFLHVSDATATRYLSQLKKEGKIKQNGKTGHTVSYSRN